MAWLATFRILFILYCVEAGVFLLLTPWSPRWEQSLIQLPATGVALFLLHPAVRGAISGFGLVHLVWGAHDLDLWLAARRHRSRESRESTPPPPEPLRESQREPVAPAATDPEVLVSKEP